MCVWLCCKNEQAAQDEIRMEPGKELFPGKNRGLAARPQNDAGLVSEGLVADGYLADFDGLYKI